MSSKINVYFNKYKENTFFELAYDFQKKANLANQNGEFLKSWALSSGARLSFIIDLVIDIAAVPFAILGIVFSAIPALFTWGKETSTFTFNRNLIEQKVNQLMLSSLGAFISPWLVVEKLHTFK